MQRASRWWAMRAVSGERRGERKPQRSAASSARLPSCRRALNAGQQLLRGCAARQARRAALRGEAWRDGGVTKPTAAARNAGRSSAAAAAQHVQARTTRGVGCAGGVAGAREGTAWTRRACGLPVRALWAHAGRDVELTCACSARPPAAACTRRNRRAAALRSARGTARWERLRWRAAKVIPTRSSQRRAARWTCAATSGACGVARSVSVGRRTSAAQNHKKRGAEGVRGTGAHLPLLDSPHPVSSFLKDGLHHDGPGPGCPRGQGVRQGAARRRARLSSFLPTCSQRAFLTAAGARR